MQLVSRRTSIFCFIYRVFLVYFLEFGILTEANCEGTWAVGMPDLAASRRDFVGNQQCNRKIRKQVTGREERNTVVNPALDLLRREDIAPGVWRYRRQL